MELLRYLPFKCRSFSKCTFLCLWLVSQRPIFFWKDISLSCLMGLTAFQVVVLCVCMRLCETFIWVWQTVQEWARLPRHSASWHNSIIPSWPRNLTLGRIFHWPAGESDEHDWTDSHFLQLKWQILFKYAEIHAHSCFLLARHRSLCMHVFTNFIRKLPSPLIHTDLYAVMRTLPAHFVVMNNPYCWAGDEILGTLKALHQHFQAYGM